MSQHSPIGTVTCALSFTALLLSVGTALADQAPGAASTDPKSANAPPAPQAPVDLAPFPTTITQPGAPPPASPAPLPIDLPYALRLVNASNPTIAIARERVREAYARQQQASVLWIPNLWAGGNPDNLTFMPTVFLHNGQIQNSRGQVFGVTRAALALGGGTGLNLSIADAWFAPRIARDVTAAEQARARMVTFDVQLDVALTYLELLRVYGASAVTQETLNKAQAMFRAAARADEAGLTKTTADVNRARTEVELRRKEQIDLTGQAAVVSAHLTQLLLLEPTLDLIPADTTVLPIILVPEDQPLDELVGLGLMNRPELAQSRALVAAALAHWRQERTRPLLPTLQMAFYGDQFAGGTPGLHDYGGRNDFFAQATWELKNAGLGNLFDARATRSQYEQANLHVREVQAQVANDVVAAAKIVRTLRLTLNHAEEAVSQSELTWAKLAKAAFGIAGPARQYDPLEPLLAEQALHEARMQYLNAVIDYNRNQFRLYWAMGQPPQDAFPKATALPVSVPVEPKPTTGPVRVP